jgi:hypothetical protein
MILFASLLTSLRLPPSLGQKLDVNIFKLTIHESVEDRILTVGLVLLRHFAPFATHRTPSQLQNVKRELAAAALSGQATKNMKLTLNDMIGTYWRISLLVV